MIIIYKCDTCGQEFKNLKECKMCEASHMTSVDHIKCTVSPNSRKTACERQMV